MTEIPLHAKVECTDGTYGESINVIVDRHTRRVTHFVVETGMLGAQRLVPLGSVASVDAKTIRLACSKAEVEAFPLFLTKDFVASEELGYFAADSLQYSSSPTPFPSVGPQLVPIEHENVPEGEVAITQGMRVEATDGSIGHVDRLISDSETGEITHAVLRHGHLWGKRDVVLPMTALDHVSEEAVYLKLSKHEVEHLPSVR